MSLMRLVYKSTALHAAVGRSRFGLSKPTNCMNSGV